ncbi:hypothetical protein SAMN02745673_01784 [Marinactinospora thermotolerans DSM 45154]|uniref:Uncharacterized protein n=1 Tax=Marinactinospora thermotolerans DSM 45154 TaxID=1122192 RepID=A0A1T4PES4_9ACTN|nr:hypothetical protein [Marinactinospora thermotolerans]SJZ90065.1 hypothetical protein SAMN02745673_01784 [Marinactinospora thermotolerans DSM 45154]
MIRLSNTLLTSVQGHAPEDRLRVEAVYDEERAILKIIVLGAFGAMSEVLRSIGTLIGDASAPRAPAPVVEGAARPPAGVATLRLPREPRPPGVPRGRPVEHPGIERR